MHIKNKIILFVALVGLLVYMISPFNIFQSNLVFANGSAEDSVVGGLQVEGLDELELQQLLQQSVTQWQGTPVVLYGGGVELKINASSLHFLVDEAVASYIAENKKPWYAFWKSKSTVNIPLTITLNDSIKQQIDNVGIWNVEGTYESLIAEASILGNHEIEAIVEDLSYLDNERISLIMREIPEESNGMGELIAVLNDKIITPNEEFSMIDTLTPIVGQFDEVALDFVASLLYNTALNTNSQILERHQQSTIPSDVAPGLEADVDLNLSQDLRFKNTTGQPFKLMLTDENGILKMEAYASQVQESVTIRVAQGDAISPKVITRYSKDLPMGSEQVIEEGTDGFRVEVWKTVSSEGTEEMVSRDFYAPTNRIVIKSSRVPETSTSTVGNDGSDNNAIGNDNTNPSGNTDTSGNGQTNNGTTTFPSDPTSDNANDYTVDENGQVIEEDDHYVYDKGGNIIGTKN